MDQQGIISKYMIKYMKNCEYLRLNNLDITSEDDCGRVPANNTKHFDITFVDGNLTSATLVDLAYYTHYRCEVCAGTDRGFGPCGHMIYRTDEGGMLMIFSIDMLYLIYEPRVLAAMFPRVWAVLSQQQGPVHISKEL